MEKSQLRKQYFLQFKDYLISEERSGAEKKIRERLHIFFNQTLAFTQNTGNEHTPRKPSLFDLFTLKKSKPDALRIMAYQPLKSEIPILQLLGDIPCELYIPEVRGTRLIPRSLQSGIKKNIRDMDFIIVPGLYISEDGFRLGRGGGFYDRLLCTYPVSRTVFVGYDWQALTELPLDAWDKPVGYWITEKRTRKCFVI